MTDETTTEQLAEIERQAEDTPATEYTPPEGWRVLAVGEVLQPGDQWVNWEGTVSRPDIQHGDGATVSGGRYIRRIKPQPQPEAQPEAQPQPVPEPEPEQYTPPEGWRVLAVGEVLRDGDMWVWPTNDQLRQTVHVGAVVGANQRYIRRIEPEPVQVREGRWRTRSGEEKNIRPCEPLKGAYYVWPWTDGFMTFQDNGRHQGSQESPHDLVEYLGPIEQQPEPQPEPQAAAIEELRSEVSYVQNLLGTERRRVTQLEELVTSLRTINEGAEKAVSGAGVVNDSLRLQLAAVKAELASVAADRQRLLIELDAAQQVPQAIADRFEEGWNQGTARAVETVLEWLEPIRAVDHPNLANETLQHLPQIMRHLTGLDSHAID